MWDKLPNICIKFMIITKKALNSSHYLELKNRPLVCEVIKYQVRNTWWFLGIMPNVLTTCHPFASFPHRYYDNNITIVCQPECRIRVGLILQDRYKQ